jgi:hypothetical protein
LLLAFVAPELEAQDGNLGGAALPPAWAFAPWRDSVPPAAADPDRAHPIDRFVAAGLAAAGLEPGPAADRGTLLRRACFVLTGLPPEPAQVAAFLADGAPGAFERALDLLLASPHYGERQARHWLDLARYSDSNGLDENLAFADAFRYRDWVVRAHNDDLPFDRFGTLQIAGDLCDEATGDEALDRFTATGFLALGPRMLAEQDKEKLVLDVVDEQIDLVGRTFLGLGLGCARCHDHKFDPVPARDYYALAGIFKSTRSFASLDHVSRWHDRELASDAAIALRQQRERAAAAADQALQAAERQATAVARAALVLDAGRYLLAGTELLGSARFVEAEAAARTSLRRDDSHWGSSDCAVLHTVAGGPQFAEWEVEIAVAGRYALAVRYAAKESRPLRVLVDGAEQVAHACAGTTGDWFPAGQQWDDAGELELHAGRNVLRLDGHGPDVPHLDKLMLLPAAAIAPTAAGLLPAIVRRVAAGLAAADLPEILRPWQALAGRPEPSGDFAAQARALQGRGGFHAVLLSGFAPESPRELAARYQTLFAAAGNAWLDLLAAAPTSQKDGTPKDPPQGLADATLEAARAVLFGAGGWFDLPIRALRPALPTDVATRLHEFTTARDAARAAVPAPAPTVMSVADGDVVDVPVHLRGSHLTLAPAKTPRGFLSALAHVPAPPLPRDRSGRRELAQWLFAPENALTARVAANRIWQRAFGQGLVRSPSNFGTRGAQPTHPELLEWLARRFVQDGWSQKKLFRLILTSRTWQLSSAERADAAMRDPDNRLLWRQNRRRLEAEAIRDAMLATAGTLDRTLGGSLLPTRNRDYVTNDQSANGIQYDSLRRSLYLPVIRNAMHDLFTAFDYCDPSVHQEQRPESAVAPQALLLLNSPFVHAQARAFAVASAAAATGDDARIGWIWQQAFQRPPAPADLQHARAWLAAARAMPAKTPAGTGTAGTGAELAVWQGLCQATFAANEFVYID